MRMRIFKRKKRVDGKPIESVTWYGEYRTESMFHPKVVNLHCSEKQVAHAKLQKIVIEEEKTENGLLPAHLLRNTAKIQLSDLLVEYVERLKGLNRTSRHIRNNRSKISQLFSDCDWNLLKDVTPESFELWRDEHRALAPKTLNDYLGLASSFFNWLVKNERLDKNPLRRVSMLPRQLVKPRRAFSDEEFNKLVSLKSRRSIVYLLAAYTGLRRSELKALQWGDLKIQGDEAWLAVRASTTKNKKSANLPLHKNILPELLAIKLHYYKPTDQMLKRRIPTMESFKKDLASVGIEYINQRGEVLDFHSLRHTFATNLLKSGVAPRTAMELMRHSDLKLTTKVYTDPSQLPLAQALDKLPWPDRNGQVTEKVTAFLVKNGQKSSKTGNTELTHDADYMNDSSSKSLTTKIYRRRVSNPHILAYTRF